MSHAARLVLALAAALLAAGSARAVTIDWVTVGNPGNPGDTLSAWTDNSSGHGSVGYTYRISKYEVTNAQYAEFLNAVAATDTNGLYHSNMGSNARGGITQSGTSGSFTYSVKTDMGNKPVNYVSFFEAMRFANWLENGQPTGAQGAGTTEAGVYTIDSGANEVRASEATYFLPSEDEWYKAAYYDPTLNSGTGGFWLFSTMSNSSPTVATADATGDISNPGANVVNYLSGADWNSQNGNVTTVGSAGLLSESFYGTADQGGNVFEWNEEVFFGTYRGLRGGTWSSDWGGTDAIGADYRSNLQPNIRDEFTGFRVASVFSETNVVPEPSAVALFVIGIAAMGFLAVRRRRRRA